MLSLNKQNNMSYCYEFRESQWVKSCNIVGGFLNYSNEKIEKLINNKILKLIGGIPFIAGCKNPMRTAVSHLVITKMAAHDSGKEVFLHQWSDNAEIKARLERISNFDGGNKVIINRGMNLLSIIMISDHIKDLDEDNENSKYNPLNNSVWNAEKILSDLENKIKQIPCYEMDKIIDIYEARSSWWRID